MTAADDMRRLIGGFRVTQMLYVAAVLGISDLLVDGPRSVEDLATATGSDADSLRRMLSALAAVGVYVEEGDGTFGLDDLGAELCSGRPAALRDWAMVVGETSHWSAWGHLLHSIRTGENAFTALHGTTVWEYRAHHPDLGALFDRAMAGMTEPIVQAVVGAYDFAEVNTVVDVAGGRGGLLVGILAANRHLSGTLFDQPQVVEDAGSHVPPDIADRLSLVAGSFFESVPAGGDVYLLKSIIHDWDDEEALAILRVCRDAMSDQSRLLLVEIVLEGPNSGAETKILDIQMLTMLGGRERSEPEYARLLKSAGLELRRVIPTASPVSILEATRLRG